DATCLPDLHSFPTRRSSDFAFENLIHAILWLLGIFASYLQWWAYVFQKIILNLGYALSPILIGFMAIHPLRHIGSRYLFNLFGGSEEHNSELPSRKDLVCRH